MPVEGGGYSKRAAAAGMSTILNIVLLSCVGVEKSDLVTLYPQHFSGPEYCYSSGTLFFV